MKNKERVLRTALWMAVLAVPGTAFQNCSGVLRFGNGGGYEGEKSDSSGIADKPKHNYVNSSLPACPDGGPRSMVTVTEGEYSEAELKRQDCQPVAAPYPIVFIISSSERPMPLTVIYNNVIHQPESDRGTPPPAPGPAPNPPVNSQQVLFCQRAELFGVVEIRVLRAADTSLSGALIIRNTAGSATAQVPLTVAQGALEFGRDVVLESNIPTGSLALSVAAFYTNASLRYNLALSLPPGANPMDSIYGVLRNGLYDNTIQPLLCFGQDGFTPDDQDDD